MAKGRNVPPKKQSKVERRLPIVSLRMAHGEDWVKVVTGHTYSVQEGQTPKEFTIGQDVIGNLSAVRALQLYGMGSNRDDEFIRSTWPSGWKYVDEEIGKCLEWLGINIHAEKFLTTHLPIEDLGLYAYPQTDLQGLYESWIDLLVFEYAVQRDIQTFQRLQQEGIFVDKLPSTIGGSINLQAIDAWLTLENCVIRIDAMWERVFRRILPQYFLGEVLTKTKGKDWGNLNEEIRKRVNPQQLQLYELLFQVQEDYMRSTDHPMKRIRERIMHEIAHRSEVFIPGKEVNLPITVKDLLTLIDQEHSRLREGMILMMGIILAKKPKNTAVAH